MGGDEWKRQCPCAVDDRGIIERERVIRGGYPSHV